MKSAPQKPPTQKLTLEQALEVIQDLYQRIVVLEAENKKLKDQLAKNSRNSSKPPSSDGYGKPKPKSRRQSGQKPNGGQKGHPGSTLEIVANPDHIVTHDVVNCVHCERALNVESVCDYEARQVIDIPPVKPSVTEHRITVRPCPHCGQINKARFPEDVTRPVQYGHRISAWVVYFGHYQLLPYKRLQEMLQDLFGVSLSQGTLSNLQARCHHQLESFEATVKEQLINSPVVHFDETGMRVNKQLHWMHVACTDTLSLYHLDSKRGKVGMTRMGILPHFNGRAIHDHLKAYYHYACQHGLCNAHHLRELIYACEQHGQRWAGKLIDCLVEAKKEIDQQPKGLSKARVIYYKHRYSRILRAGRAEMPMLAEPEGNQPKRGRKKQHKVKNLHDRLTKHKAETLAFVADVSVPFDNNLAERDLRMNKAKQKISGCFRSMTGGQRFARIRSYISTVRKQNQDVMTALIDAFGANPVIPK